MTETQIPVLELRKLLFELRDFRPDVCVRFRMMGEMWQIHSSRIIKMTEKGVVLNDEKSSKLIFIQDLNQVMQFEIDQAFQNFQPHFHYKVSSTQ